MESTSKGLILMDKRSFSPPQVAPWSWSFLCGHLVRYPYHCRLSWHLPYQRRLVCLFGLASWPVFSSRLLPSVSAFPQPLWPSFQLPLYGAFLPLLSFVGPISFLVQHGFPCVWLVFPLAF